MLLPPRQVSQAAGRSASALPSRAREHDYLDVYKKRVCPRLAGSGCGGVARAIVELERRAQAVRQRAAVQLEYVPP